MPKGRGRHLTLGDRMAIQQMMTDGEHLPDIARAYECRFYDALMAHESYSHRKTASREGIDCTMEDLEKMAGYVRPLLKRGQSPEFIWSHHGDELPVSLRTFYAYVEAGVFEDIVNLVYRRVQSSSRRSSESHHSFASRISGDAASTQCAKLRLFGRMCGRDSLKWPGGNTRIEALKRDGPRGAVFACGKK